MSDALDRVRRALDGTQEADDALRATVRALVEEPGVVWAAIAFVEGDDLVVGPSAGVPDEERRAVVPVRYQGERVGELWVDGDAGSAELEEVAGLVSAHVLLGWDTGGEAWVP